MENYTTPKPILPAPGEEEVWKPHPLYPAYEISTFGNVRRAKDEYMMKQTVNARGYLTVHLRTGIENPNGRQIRIHRLVAETFLGEAPEGTVEIDHLDRNRHNNYFKNLRWATRQENVDNSKRKKKIGIYMKRPALVLLDKDTHGLIREFKHLEEVVQELGISPAGVRDNIHGYRPPYTFGYFMTKDDYLKKITEKT